MHNLGLQFTTRTVETDAIAVHVKGCLDSRDDAELKCVYLDVLVG